MVVMSDKYLWKNFIEVYNKTLENILKKKNVNLNETEQ